MVKQMERSAFSKARAKAAGAGQAVEEAVFSVAMAARSSCVFSSSVSQYSFSPTRRHRGITSKAAAPLLNCAVRISQLLSLTMFHVIFVSS